MHAWRSLPRYSTSGPTSACIGGVCERRVLCVLNVVRVLCVSVCVLCVYASCVVRVLCVYCVYVVYPIVTRHSACPTGQRRAKRYCTDRSTSRGTRVATGDSTWSTLRASSRPPPRKRRTCSAVCVRVWFVCMACWVSGVCRWSVSVCSPVTHSVRGGFLYRLLRPELVKSNAVPLSSNALSNWTMDDSDRADQDVRGHAHGDTHTHTQPTQRPRTDSTQTHTDTQVTHTAHTQYTDFHAFSYLHTYSPTPY